MVDGVLLVIEAEHTYKNAARCHAVTNLHQIGANLLGVVLNAVPSKGYGYYQYYSTQGRSNPNRGKLRLPNWGGRRMSPGGSSRSEKDNKTDPVH